MRNTAGMNFYRQGVRVVAALVFGAIVFSGVSRGADAMGAQNLGEGLVYFRVTNLAEQMGEVRSALAKNAALAVDLRGVAASMTDARALRTALVPLDAKARVVRFVLINKETGPAIPFTLDAGLPESAVPGVLVIAPMAAEVPADVKAPGTVEDDRLACEAIARGADLASLINHQPEKKRYDEAVLVREHQGVAEPEVAQADGDGAGTDGSDATTKAAVAKKVVTDSVLEVAVRTHRALVALKKI